MRFIVFNDVHANSIALAKLVKSIALMKFDKLIFLGDALTYGVNVKETINLLHELNGKYDCVFVKGNHEQIYFDFQKNTNYQYKDFPNFILESISDTARKLNCVLEDEFDWVDNFYYEGVVFSHANLFEYGNWSYLNTENDFKLNYGLLVDKNLRGAIFGHTHRAKYKKFKIGLEESCVLDFPARSRVFLELNEGFLMTSGSLGQPRGSISSFLVCDIDSANISLELVPVEYDVAMHCKSINKSGLTSETKSKLLKYYN